MLQNVTMDQFLLYFGFLIAFGAFLLSLYACVRVGSFIKATEGLEWDAIANITGDLATTKKTIQTLNNRLNGLHSPKAEQENLMLELLKQRSIQQPNGKMQKLGG